MRRRVLFITIGMVLAGFCSGCMHTYEITKKDGSKVYARGKAITVKDGYISVRPSANAGFGIFHASHILKAESARRMTSKEVKKLEQNKKIRISQ